MRIAFVNWSGRLAGGIESYVETTVAALHALGHDVALWVERDEPVDRAPVDVPAGMDVWCAARDGVSPTLDRLTRWRPSVLFVHGLTDPAIESRVLEIAPAAFLAHSYYGTCISGGKTFMFPTPRACTRTFGPACLALFYPRRCGGLSPLTLARDYRRQADRLTLVHRYGLVLTLSAHMRTEYVRHGLDPERVRELPRYRPSVSRRCPRPGARESVDLLFLGRLDRLKGCRLAIDALPAVHAALDQPVRLIVAGDGPDIDVCRRKAQAVSAQNGIDVTFRQWVDGDTRAHLLGDADALVVPSIWPEPYGLSGLEAVAAGLPVAAFRSGGISEWLQDPGEGALAPVPPTAGGLANAIVRAVRAGRREPAPVESLAAQHTEHIQALVAAFEALAGTAPVAPA